MHVLALLEGIPLLGLALLIGHGNEQTGMMLLALYPIYFVLRRVSPARQ